MSSEAKLRQETKGSLEEKSKEKVVSAPPNRHLLNADKVGHKVMCGRGQELSLPHSGR